MEFCGRLKITMDVSRSITNFYKIIFRIYYYKNSLHSFNYPLLRNLTINIILHTFIIIIYTYIIILHIINDIVTLQYYNIILYFNYYIIIIALYYIYVICLTYVHCV